MERGFIRLNVAVLAIGDAVTLADEPPAQIILDRFTTAGHNIVAKAVVGDTLQAIRARFLEWIADPAIDVVLALAGTKTEYGAAALAPLVTRPLVGFSDLFRFMTFEEIGTAAMLVDADAAQCKSTFVFLLPSSIGAVRTALDRLIIPQLDYRTKPANLVMRMPRIAHVEVAEAVEPEPWITPKRPTAAGIAAVPAPPRPPARAKTIPPPIPERSISRKLDAVPQFTIAETTNVGAAPAPRQKVSTLPAGLPNRPPAPPAPPAPMVEELEATPPKTREFEVVEKTGPIPRTPSPSVMVDTELSKPIKLATPAIVDTSRPIDADYDRSPRVGSTPRAKASNNMGFAWLGLAVAAAAILVFVMMRQQDEPIAASDPAVDDRVATITPMPEMRAEPPLPPQPPPEPPPVVEPLLAVVAPDAAGEIEMPVEPLPEVVKKPRVARTPADAGVPEEPKEPELAPVTAENGCDEVSCALDRYKQACCAPFKPAPPPPPKPVSDVPEKIDREMIVEGVGKVKPAVVLCGEVHPTKGTVKLRVQVDAGGNVGDVSVSSTPDEQLGACVAAAVKKATFGKTQNGGSFGYPFVF